MRKRLQIQTLSLPSVRAQLAAELELQQQQQSQSTTHLLLNHRHALSHHSVGGQSDTDDSAPPSPSVAGTSHPHNTTLQLQNDGTTTIHHPNEKDLIHTQSHTPLSSSTIVRSYSSTFDSETNHHGSSNPNHQQPSNHSKPSFSHSQSQRIHHRTPPTTYYPITCYLIGRTTLLIRCAEYLLRKHCTICGVCSTDPEVIQWCTEKHIQIIEFDHFADQLEAQRCDYVFSIFNPRILRKRHIEAPLKCIINCHDAPLPRYGGVNAVPHAISRCETSHGITWHRMCIEIDEGDIIEQVHTPLTSQTTTLTLRLQLIDDAYRGFKKMILRILATKECITGTPQNMDEKLYFNRFAVFDSMGYINFQTMNATQIHALVRACQFGSHDFNSLGLAKVYINQRWLNVTWTFIQSTQEILHHMNVHSNSTQHHSYVQNTPNLTQSSPTPITSHHPSHFTYAAPDSPLYTSAAAAVLSPLSATSHTHHRTHTRSSSIYFPNSPQPHPSHLMIQTNHPNTGVPIERLQSAHQPGTIVAVCEDFILVSTLVEGEYLGIRGFSDLSGKQISASEANQLVTFQFGMVLNSDIHVDDVQCMSWIANEFIKYEQYYTKQLGEFTPATLQSIPHHIPYHEEIVKHITPTHPCSSPSSFKSKYQTYNFHDSLSQRIKQHPSFNYTMTDLFIAAVISVFIGITSHDEFIELAISSTFDITSLNQNQPTPLSLSPTSPIHSLIAAFLPFKIKSSELVQNHQILTILQYLQLIHTSYTVATKNPCFHRDIYTRYPALHHTSYKHLTRHCIQTIYNVQQIDAFEGDLLFHYNNEVDHQLCITFNSENVSLSMVGIIVNALSSSVDTLLMYANDPQKTLHDCMLLDPPTAHRMIHEWNDTINDHHMKLPLVPQQIIESAMKHPNHIALKYGDESQHTMTYHQLISLSLWLSNTVLSASAQRNKPIAIIMESDGCELIIGILAAWLYGAPYVPIDSKAPINRIQHILNDSDVQCIFTLTHIQQRLSSLSNDGTNHSGIRIPMHTLDTLIPYDAIAAIPFEQLQAINLSFIQPSTLAYIIYTSGSTGLPKGVAVQHDSIRNTSYNHSSTCHVTSASNLYLIVPYYFDPSIMALSSILSSAGTLVLKPRHIVGGIELANSLVKNETTHTALTPSLLATIIPESLADLTVTIIVGGESCPPTIIQQYTATGQHRLINQYGPTETTVACTSTTLTMSDINNVTIGRPLPNYSTYIVDRCMRCVPCGIAGELLVGGIGVARGYVNLPEQTEQRFIKNILTADSSYSRVYKTGDLCRYHHDGRIEFIGRADKQVKLRGYRIELGEVESAISTHRDVQQCVCMVRSDASNRDTLVAYIQPATVDISTLKQHISSSLPEYMIPSIFVPMSYMPSTSNGKVDRNALPAPSSSIMRHTNGTSSAVPLVLPSDPTSKALHDIWRESLQLLESDSMEFGIDDTWASLGGTSLLAAKMVSKIRNRLDNKFTVADLMYAPSIRQSSTIIQRRQSRTPLTGSSPRKMSLVNLYTLSSDNATQVNNSSNNGNMNQNTTAVDSSDQQSKTPNSVMSPTSGTPLLISPRRPLSLNRMGSKRNNNDGQSPLRSPLRSPLSASNMVRSSNSSAGAGVVSRDSIHSPLHQHHHYGVGSTPSKPHRSKFSKITTMGMGSPLLGSGSKTLNYPPAHPIAPPSLNATAPLSLAVERINSTRSATVPPPSVVAAIARTQSSSHLQTQPYGVSRSEQTSPTSKHFPSHDNITAKGLIRHSSDSAPGSPHDTPPLRQHDGARVGDVSRDISIRIPIHMSDPLNSSQDLIDDTAAAMILSTPHFMGTTSHDSTHAHTLHQHTHGSERNSGEDSFALPAAVVVHDESSDDEDEEPRYDAEMEEEKREKHSRSVDVGGNGDVRVDGNMLGDESESDGDSESDEQGESYVDAEEDFDPWPPQHVAEAKASRAQSRIYIDEVRRIQQDRSNTTFVPIYNVPFVFTIHTTAENATRIVSGEKLRQALNALSIRHSIMRTKLTFHATYGLQQVVMPAAIFDVVVHTSSKVLEKSDIESLIITTKLDVSTGEVMRGYIVYQPNGHTLILLVIHHIATDGMSRSIFLRELSQLYDSMNPMDDVMSMQPYLPIQYIDYSIHENRNLEEGALDLAIAWWTQILDGCDHIILDLPLDRPRPSVRSSASQNVYATIPADIGARIVDYQQHHPSGCSMFMLCLTALNIVMYKITGQNDICIGSVSSNRYRRDMENLIGFFVNTLCYRTQIQPLNHTFNTLVYQVTEYCKLVLDPVRARTPFDLLVSKICKDSSPNPNVTPFFQVALDVQHNTLLDAEFYIHDTESGESLEITPTIMQSPGSIFDMKLDITVEQNNRFTLNIEYAVDIFDPSTVQSIADRFVVLMSALFAENTIATQVPISFIYSLIPTESIILQPYQNYSLVPQTTDYVKTIAQHCISHVTSNPTKPAVISIDEGRVLTYSELYAASCVVASHLSASTPNEEQCVVACLLPRSIHMCIAMMSIQLNGHIYLPLSIKDPAERIITLCHITSAQAVLTTTEYQPLLVDSGYQGVIICMDTIEYKNEERIQECMRRYNVDVINSQSVDSLAYLIFTSGSTGKPKSVSISHRAFNAYVYGDQQMGIMLYDDIVIQMCAVSFDVHLHETYDVWCSGSTCVMLKHDGNLDVEYLANIIEQSRATYITMVPSQFIALEMSLNQSNSWHKLASLRQLSLGGEPFPPRIIPIVHKHLPRCKLTNAYGPAECTVQTTLHTCTADDYHRNSVPLGIPLHGYQVYILDEYMSQMSVYHERMGELYIGGAALMDGYWNEEDLTAAALHDVYLNGDYNNIHRIYKTGDLVRLTRDGKLLYCGRSDHQVKLRGQRLELGEVMKQIELHDAVVNAYVMKQEEESVGSPYLAAYIQLKPDIRLDDLHHVKRAVYAHLSRNLPSYMIPSAFVFTQDPLPITTNGKIDRANLPVPNASHMAHIFFNASMDDIIQSDNTNLNDGVDTLKADDVVIQASNVYESRLQEIFSKILNREKSEICCKRSLRKYGIDSIMYTRIVSLIRQSLSPSCTLHDLFKHSTIQLLAKRLQQYDNNLPLTLPTSAGPMNADSIYINVTAEKPTTNQGVTHHQPTLLTVSSPDSANGFTEVAWYDRWFHRYHTLTHCIGILLLTANFSLAVSASYYTFDYMSSIISNVYGLNAIRYPIFFAVLNMSLLIILLVEKWILYGWASSHSTDMASHTHLTIHTYRGVAHWKHWFITRQWYILNAMYALSLFHGTSLYSTILWLFGINIGSRVQVYTEHIDITAGNQLIIGDDTIICSLAQIVNQSVVSGDIGIGRIVHESIMIGSNCVIAERAVIEGKTQIQNYSHISPSTTVRGEVKEYGICQGTSVTPYTGVGIKRKHRYTILQHVMQYILITFVFSLSIQPLSLISYIWSICIPQDGDGDNYSIAYYILLPIWWLIWSLVTCILLIPIFRWMIGNIEIGEYQVCSWRYIRHYWLQQIVMKYNTLYLQQLSQIPTIIPYYLRLCGATYVSTSCTMFGPLPSYVNLPFNMLYIEGTAIIASSVTLGANSISTKGIWSVKPVVIRHDSFVGNYALLNVGSALEQSTVLGSLSVLTSYPCSTLSPSHSHSASPSFNKDSIPEWKSYFTQLTQEKRGKRHDDRAGTHIHTDTHGGSVRASNAQDALVMIGNPAVQAPYSFHFVNKTAIHNSSLSIVSHYIILLILSPIYIILPFTILLASSIPGLWIVLTIHKHAYNVNSGTNPYTPALMLITLPVSIICLLLSTTLFLCLSKWLCIGRWSSANHPLYSRWWIGRTLYTSVLAMYKQITQLYITDTELMCMVCRLLGSRIGGYVSMHDMLLESDLITIGHNCVIQRDAIIQGHTMEYGVFRHESIFIQNHCIVGIYSLLFPGSTLRDYVSIGANTLIMKGSIIQEQHYVYGNPSTSQSIHTLPTISHFVKLISPTDVISHRQESRTNSNQNSRSNNNTNNHVTGNGQTYIIKQPLQTVPAPRSSPAPSMRSDALHLNTTLNGNGDLNVNGSSIMTSDQKQHHRGSIAKKKDGNRCLAPFHSHPAYSSSEAHVDIDAHISMELQKHLALSTTSTAHNSTL